MQIQYKGGRIVHIDNAVGRDLIARGLATEVLPPPKPVPNTTWKIKLGATLQLPPSIHASCDTCKGFAFSGGPNTPTRMQFLHCLTCEAPPHHIAEQYKRAYRAWERKEEPRPSSVSPEQREIEKKRLAALKTHKVRAI